MNAFDYSNTLAEAQTTVDFFRDMTGSDWALAVAGQTLRELLDAGDNFGARILIKNLLEGSQQEFRWEAEDDNGLRASVFQESLSEIISVGEGDDRN